jgi:hypothetical protein
MLESEQDDMTRKGAGVKVQDYRLSMESSAHPQNAVLPGPEEELATNRANTYRKCSMNRQMIIQKRNADGPAG